MSVQKRRTRLKGTESKKPCFGCGKTKDRFQDFKPRWAGCSQHVTAKGRRFFQAGCVECEQIVNGNIRQPRCISCDKARQKKVSPAPTIQTPETPTIETLAAVVTDEVVSPIEAVAVESEVSVEVEEPDQTSVAVPTIASDETALAWAARAAAYEEEVEESEEAHEEPAPVVVEPETRPEPEETPVVIAPPPPAPSPAPATPSVTKKKVASKADLFALFAGEAEAQEEETKPPF